MHDPAPTACLIIIGNEILSGRTQDSNLRFLAKELNLKGIRLREVRVIPDVEQTIVDTVNACRAAFTYIFTTGGIGPTHDDITSASVAKAFGVALEKNPEAAAMLDAHYGAEHVTPARLRMAYVPAGAQLVENPVSGAPGFQIGNVFVLAGVPHIMQAMYHNLKDRLKDGAIELSETLSARIPESYAAEGLRAIQSRHPEVDIGSYPHMKDKELSVSIVMRATDAKVLAAAKAEVHHLLASLADEVIEGEI
ncbi:MAG: competence/damage-inducible protein A [Alphaproteobacteria bacterium]|nr:competence/damage-inducible protein A [Alphaproteobacteria bacterium]